MHGPAYPHHGNLDALEVVEGLNSRVFDEVASSAERVLGLVREDIAVWRTAGCIEPGLLTSRWAVHALYFWASWLFLSRCNS